MQDNMLEVYKKMACQQIEPSLRPGVSAGDRDMVASRHQLTLVERPTELTEGTL